MDNWVGSWYWKLQLIEGRFGYALRWAILGPNASRRQQQVNDLQIQLFIQQLNFSLAVRASGEKRLRQFLHNNKKKTFIIPLLLDEKRNQKKMAIRSSQFASRGALNEKKAWETDPPVFVCLATEKNFI